MRVCVCVCVCVRMLYLFVRARCGCGFLGRETIAAMARAGPEMQAKLLQGLGLKGFLVTDGKNPINLFNTAQGMVAH